MYVCQKKPHRISTNVKFCNKQIVLQYSKLVYYNNNTQKGGGLLLKKYLSFLFICLISIFFYGHFNSHIDWVKDITLQDNSTTEIFTDNLEVSTEESEKLSFLTYKPIDYSYTSIIIAITCLSYMLVQFFRIFALLTPVLFQSNYVIVYSFGLKI